MRLKRYANPKTLAGCPGLVSDTDIALRQRSPNSAFEYQGPPIRNVASAAAAAPGIFTSSMMHPADLFVRFACRGLPAMLHPPRVPAPGPAIGRAGPLHFGYGRAVLYLVDASVFVFRAYYSVPIEI